MFNRIAAFLLFGVFLLSSCVSPQKVTVSSPLPGTEIAVVTSTGTQAVPAAILIGTVTEDGPAWKAGLRSGMKAVSINGTKPMTAAHALALCNDSERIEIAVAADGKEQTFSVARQGLFGISFVNETPPSSVINASGEATKIAVTQGQHETFIETIKPTVKKSSRSLGAAGGAMAGVGGLYTLLGIIFSATMSTTTTYNYTTKQYETVENPTGKALSSTFLGIGIPVAVTGLVMLMVNANSKTYATTYAIPAASFTPHSLFPEGFNPKTGLNVYGITRDGTFPDGTRFEGSVKNGKMEGYGKMTSADGKSVLAGVFSGGYLNGLATVTSLSDPAEPRLAWFGYFKNSKMDGFGIEFGKDGKPSALTLYEDGIKKSSQAYPARPLPEADNLLFLGEGFKSGLAEGKGVAISMDGAMSQSGTFSQGYLAEGTKKSADGTVLTGTFVKGELAEGSFRGASGVGGSGTWKNGKLLSPGTLYRADGSVYSGAFDANGLAQGSGTMRYANGDSFKGAFKNDVPEGTGTYTFATGTTYTGDVAKGTFEGKGVQVKPNGETYEGEFLGGLPHGMGIYKYNGSVERAEYYEGKRIDQLYLIRLENEKQRIEKARLAEEQAQREREAEARRIAEERRQQEIARQKAQEAQAAKRNKALFGAVLGAATGAMAMNAGGTFDEGVYLGASVYKDVVSGTMGSENSFSNAALDDLGAGLQSGDRWNLSQIADTSLFSEKPVSRSAAGKASSGDSGGGSGGSITGTWRSAKGDVVTLTGNSITYGMTQSINGNPGQMYFYGTYTYDAASQRLQYTFTERELTGSAAYDTGREKVPNPKTSSDTFVVSGNTLTFGSEQFTR